MNMSYCVHTSNFSISNFNSFKLEIGLHSIVIRREIKNDLLLSSTHTHEKKNRFKVKSRKILQHISFNSIHNIFRSSENRRRRKWKPINISFLSAFFSHSVAKCIKVCVYVKERKKKKISRSSKIQP